MNSQTTVDYIIVGQGLAGSCLALQLMQQGKRIVVIDSVHENSATRVAAGLFNPITGRNMTLTWMADTLFPYLHGFYEQAEQITSASFFHPMPLYRPFVSIEEQNEWMGKSSNASIAAYLTAVHTSPIEEDQVQNKFGGLMIKQCGYLNTIKFCEAVRQYIQQTNSLVEQDFREEELIVEEDSIRYLQFKASKIIFCQGERAGAGKFFSWLPIRPLKGETLSISTSTSVSKIYNRGVYLVPEIWKVGATYQFKDTSPTITEEGRIELVTKLNELVNFPYQITAQSWGLRPTTPDRRPILGPHPDHSSLVIFNGLGTKGVSLAPYFSKVLAAWMENGTPINKEVDIHRYKHYNYGGNLLR
ncbi:MAG TPA: FAD-binding oxidoreductase [Cyclobacteriaceae bacterium]|nr:FAD-binding oxidoreductase [Cyclobacteriaceae bacterium]